MFELYRTILQMLRHREHYDKIRSAVDLRFIDADVRRMVRAIDAYWKTYTDHNVASKDLMMTTLLTQNTDLGDDQINIISGMLDVMTTDPEPEAAVGIIRSLREVSFGAALEKAYEDYNSGADMDLFQKVKDICGRYEKDLTRDEKAEIITASLQEVLDYELSGQKLSWALDCINQSIPALCTGMQFIIAARPGVGKTSFCAFNGVQMARTSPDDRPVIWFNNEGKSVRIMGTAYRAALKATLAELSDMGAKEANKHFAEAVCGTNKFMVVNAHGRDYQFVERIIDQHRPAVVFFDMLDNVKGFSDSARRDLQLEELYQWAREAAVIYDFLSLPTKQVSVEGDNLAWVPASALKDSKTGVQGACDGIITIGAKTGKGFEKSRYIYIPKEPKQEPMPGAHPNCMKEVIFDKSKCQFIEAVQAGPADNTQPGDLTV